MTANVLKVLQQIQEDDIFTAEIYFVGGTALSYYLEHRVSEDIDIICFKALEYKKVIPAMTALGAMKIQDQNITALRMAGLVADEYILKFILDDVKIEFFQANRAIQQEILHDANFSCYEDSKLKILDLKSIAKLKLVALWQREKSRDLFDFGVIIENRVLMLEEILSISSTLKGISTLDELILYIRTKSVPLDDESVYATQVDRVNLSFDEIKKDVIKKLKMIAQ